MKSLLRTIAPACLVEWYRNYRRAKDRERNRGRSSEAVFTDIYAKNAWGGAKGEFFSGRGSVDEDLVAPYISLVSDTVSRDGLAGSTFVDLGCGDFRIGHRLLPFCSRYTGVDVVRPLVDRNQEQYGCDTVRFVALDIVADALPVGEVCLVRQVFQHLSNQDICSVLLKLQKFKLVIITEHYPTGTEAPVPNLDKVRGGDTRVLDNSGVYLSVPPFNLPEQSLSLALELPVTYAKGSGVLRTFLYRPLSA